MNVLVLNSGSSSVKFGIFSVVPGSLGNSCPPLAKGSVKGIGGLAKLDLTAESSPHVPVEREIADHQGALEWIFEQLALLRAHQGNAASLQSIPLRSSKSVSSGPASSVLASVEAVGHRVVHGGDRFQDTVRITDLVLEEIEALSELAPLHNPAGVMGIRVARMTLGHGVPNVAVFDTTFHHAMPACASTYAIPHDVAARHRIRRYGFHGIAHASLIARYTAATGSAVEDLRLIIFHLGNGCSAAAVRAGRSIDTSMGFTPLEGLVMGTRSGDIDPAVVGYLVRREGMAVQEVEQCLNEQSGLLGISGRSRDMSHLLTAAEHDDDRRAALAIDVFCYRARKYLGAYLAALGGADAVVFGGGMGENVPAVRAKICENMQWCGLAIDKERNAQAVGLNAGTVARISPDTARLPAYVVPADEESWIAGETVRCLNPGNS
jgi:acetate kinase